MSVDEQLMAVESADGSSIDPIWRDRAIHTIAELEQGVGAWYESSRRIGDLLEQVEVNEYYQVQGYGSFAEFLDGHGWNRREIRKLQSFYRGLCEKTGGAAGEVAAPDREALLEADARLAKEDASPDVSEASTVVTVEPDVAEYRNQWASSGPSTPRPEAADRQSPADRSDYDHVLKRVSTWSDEQITELVLHIAHAKRQERILGPMACVDLVEALDSADGGEFLRELVARRNFFVGSRAVASVRMLIDKMSSEDLARVAEAIQQRREEAVDVSEM